MLGRCRRTAARRMRRAACCQCETEEGDGDLDDVDVISGEDGDNGTTAVPAGDATGLVVDTARQPPRVSRCLQLRSSAVNLAFLRALRVLNNASHSESIPHTKLQPSPWIEEAARPAVVDVYCGQRRDEALIA